MPETIAKRYYRVNSNLHVPFDSSLLFTHVMENKEVRRLNLVFLKLGHGSVAEVGRRTEIDPNILRAIINRVDGRNLGDRQARKIEEKLELGRGWMDVLHGESDELEPVAMPAGMAQGIPVVGSVRGGPDGYYAELEHATGQGEGFIRYPTRDPNTYALRVKGDSMRPRIRPGEFIVVSPNSQPIVGDEAVIKTRDGRVMVKLYASPRNGSIELHSINHDHKPITIETSEIEYIHHVLIIAKADTYYPSMGL